MLNKLKLTVAILGAGNMGTALAQVIARNGYLVKIWNHERDPIPLEQINKFHENKKYLSGIKLSPNILPVSDLSRAVQGVRVVILVVPSSFMAALIERVIKYLPSGVVCVDASKGLDEISLGSVPDLIKSKLPSNLRKGVVSISGPSIAVDMARGGFTAMNIASKSDRSINMVKQILESDNLKLTATKDIKGVEVAGSFKNVYAIAMGICDGLKYPLNTKSALLVSALQEMEVLVKKMGGKASTVYGLAGLGDLVGTGLCATSRDRRFGEYLAAGMNRRSAIKKVGQVVEGVSACQILNKLIIKYKVSMPFANMIYGIVWNGKNPTLTFREFLRKL